jgi:serine/threonine-protein kinase HipA
MASGNIYVYADWIGLNGPLYIGNLRVESIRGNEVFSFEYDNNWLRSDQLFVLDPDLNYYSGPQYLQDDKPNFGMFLDSSPDRWGRVLMRRREALLARMENRAQKNLMQSDYLLGVFDEHRMGALRFKEALDGPFLNDNREMAAPPWISLRELEYASLQLENDDSVQDPEYLKWLNLLIAPGSSLGGARPKASVSDKYNHLWIAKFPSRKDDVDVGGWEMVVHDLAISSGIKMPDAIVQKFTSDQYTYISKRFDRQSGNQRIHFASAMTMLGRNDGDNYSNGLSYLDIAGFIMQSGDKNHVGADLQELWKRIVFNICIKNTDDHLRNHGFLLGKHGWKLSPAYDINPIPTGTGLTLNITDEDNSLDTELALEVADFFRVEIAKAKETINMIKERIKDWQKIAIRYGLSKREQDLMSAAFEHY